MNIIDNTKENCQFASPTNDYVVGDVGYGVVTDDFVKRKYANENLNKVNDVYLGVTEKVYDVNTKVSTMSKSIIGGTVDTMKDTISTTKSKFTSRIHKSLAAIFGFIDAFFVATTNLLLIDVPTIITSKVSGFLTLARPYVVIFVSKSKPAALRALNAIAPIVKKTTPLISPYLSGIVKFTDENPTLSNYMDIATYQTLQTIEEIKAYCGLYNNNDDGYHSEATTASHFDGPGHGNEECADMMIEAEVDDRDD
jgi:phage-related protein